MGDEKVESVVNPDLALHNNPKHILHRMTMIKIITRDIEDDNDDDAGDEHDAIEDENYLVLATRG